MGHRNKSHVASPVGLDGVSSCIVRTIGVAGGQEHIAGTRIPVWSLEDARRRGISDDRVLEMYPTINREQLQAAHVYADFHIDEMDRLIAKNGER